MRCLSLLLAMAAFASIAAEKASRRQALGSNLGPNRVRVAAGIEKKDSANAVRFSDGNSLVNRVLAMLERRPNVAARARHQVRLDEHMLAGTGQYWQLGVGNERRTRLDLQTQVAGQSASLLQIFDSRYLWTDRRLPSGRKVTRLDPIRLQAGLTSAPVSRQGRPTAATSLISTAASRGGLCGQLADLVKNFDFSPPKATQLNGMAVYALVGRWKLEELQQLWPGSRNANNKSTATAPSSRWPSQLPQHVLLLVGAENLFPYVIEYRRGSDAPLADSAAGYLPIDDPLSRFELFDVQFTAAIDRRQFEFTSSDIEWTNETPQLIKKMRERVIRNPKQKTTVR